MPCGSRYVDAMWFEVSGCLVAQGKLMPCGSR